MRSCFDLTSKHVLEFDNREFKDGRAATMEAGGRPRQCVVSDARTSPDHNGYVSLFAANEQLYVLPNTRTRELRIGPDVGPDGECLRACSLQCRADRVIDTSSPFPSLTNLIFISYDINNNNRNDNLKKKIPIQT